MISLTINGKPRELEAETALPDLLRSLDVDPRLVAVAVNGEVIPKTQYEGAVVREGDVVEIVRMVGGGAPERETGRQAGSGRAGARERT